MIEVIWNRSTLTRPSNLLCSDSVSIATSESHDEDVSCQALKESTEKRCGIDASCQTSKVSTSENCGINVSCQMSEKDAQERHGIDASCQTSAQSMEEYCNELVKLVEKYRRVKERLTLDIKKISVSANKYKKRLDKAKKSMISIQSTVDRYLSASTSSRRETESRPTRTRICTQPGCDYREDSKSRNMARHYRANIQILSKTQGHIVLN